MRFILDTNIFLAYLKENKVRQFIENNFQPFSIENIPIVSVITLGEVESLALRNNWGRNRIQAVNKLFEKCVVTKINTKDVIKTYGEIGAYSQGKLSSSPTNMSSRNMGKNDLWIASTAAVLNAKLISTDKDFAHLNGVYLDLIHIEL